jgi:hypothetical protein
MNDNEYILIITDRNQDKILTPWFYSQYDIIEVIPFIFMDNMVIKYIKKINI